MKAIPRAVAAHYAGGSREFKGRRRQALRALKKALADLRLGSAYFPTSYADVVLIAAAAARIEKDISIKHWGR